MGAQKGCMGEQGRAFIWTRSLESMGKKIGEHVERWERPFKQSSNSGMRTNEFELALGLET